MVILKTLLLIPTLVDITCDQYHTFKDWYWFIIKTNNTLTLHRGQTKKKTTDAFKPDIEKIINDRLNIFK